MAEPTDDSARTKNCTRCGEEKPYEAFGRSKSNTTTGRMSWCKKCRAEAMAEKRSRDPERLARQAEIARRIAAGVKVCRGCKAELPFAHFAKCASSPDGIDPRCKDCNNEYMRSLYASDPDRWRAKSREKSRKMRRSEARLEYERRWREENRERMREQYRARFAADPSKELEKSVRRRARLAGARLGFVDRELLWIRQCGICSLCERRIDPDLKWPNPMSKSIDHVTPLSQGGAHSQENLSWTHLRCNISKGARLPA